MSIISEIVIEFLPGSDIEDATKAASSIAKTNTCKVKFNFNGVVMMIDRYSFVDNLLYYYTEKIKEQPRKK